MRVLFVDLDETLVSTGLLLPEGQAPRVRVAGGPFGPEFYSVLVRPGASEALEAAREEFDAVHVFTAASRGYAEPVLRAAGLRDLVDEVYTVEDVFSGKHPLPNLRGVKWSLIDNDEGIAMTKISAATGPMNIPIMRAMERYWVFIPDFAPKNLRDMDNYEPIDLAAAVDAAAWRTR